ncbi:MAG: DNA alkylation repair protein, partial [Phycisphaerales bacterium]
MPAKMTVKEILAHLRSCGNETRRAHNEKAGVPANHFGVPMGEIRALAKKIRNDHALGLKLHETGNVEAQLVAALIMNPKELTAKDLDGLTRATTCAQVADWMNSYVVAKHEEKEALREKWMDSKETWTARAGWHLTASGVNKGTVEAGELAALLDRIERELATAKPDVQWTMNNALMAIGIKHPRHRARAIAVGARV